MKQVVKPEFRLLKHLRGQLPGCMLPELEPHDALRLADGGVRGSSGARVTRYWGKSNIQASEKGISRVHVQYGKLPWLDSQHRKQGKADNEACGCRKIESTEDQQSIPPAHCGGKRALASFLAAERENICIVNSSSTEACMRPMRVTITAVQGHGLFYWRLLQKLGYGIVMRKTRLTCKPAFFLFSPAWSRQWGTRGLVVVRRQSDIA